MLNQRRQELGLEDFVPVQAQLEDEQMEEGQEWIEESELDRCSASLPLHSD